MRKPGYTAQTSEKARPPHLAFGHPLPQGEGILYTFSLWEKDRMRAFTLSF